MILKSAIEIRVFSVCLVVLCATRVLNAQIVNVESKRTEKTQEGWHGSLNLSLNLTRNTTDVLDYGAKATVQYLKERHRLLVISDLSR